MFDPRHDAAFGDALMDLGDAHLAQAVDNKARRFMALQAQLGVHVQVAPPA